MLYPNKPTRLTLYTTAGVPALRYTLQSTAKSGKTNRFTLEGAVKTGALPNRYRQLVFKGWRQSIDLLFERDTLSTKETWSSGWVAAGQVPTAAALSDVLRYADAYPVAVEPHGPAANGWGFSDGRVYGNALKLQDLKGVTHSKLELHITREALWPDLPPFYFVDPSALTPTAFL